MRLSDVQRNGDVLRPPIKTLRLREHLNTSKRGHAAEPIDATPLM